MNSKSRILHETEDEVLHNDEILGLNLQISKYDLESEPNKEDENKNLNVNSSKNQESFKSSNPSNT